MLYLLLIFFRLGISFFTILEMGNTNAWPIKLKQKKAMRSFIREINA